MDIIKKHHSLALGLFCGRKDITKYISIERAIMIYHGSPYEMQTEMSRGPLAEDEHCRKKEQWGRPAALTVPFFLPWSSSAFPLAFLSAFTPGRSPEI